MKARSNPSTSRSILVQVRKCSYKGDLGYVTSSEGGEVQLLLIPRLLQLQASRGITFHFPFASTLFNCSATKQLYNIEPVCIQDNIYLFQGARFEYRLVIKSYTSDLVSTTISCMLLKILCLFVESWHPKLIASMSSLLKHQFRRMTI